MALRVSFDGPLIDTDQFEGAVVRTLVSIGQDQLAALRTSSQVVTLLITVASVEVPWQVRVNW